MPYCPKCDMEFVNGVTVCSDCGGSLAESKEAAKALNASLPAAEDTVTLPADETMESGTEDTQPKPARVRQAAYVKKSQKYEDRKSSASAFFLVGGLITVFSILCLAGIFDMPMTGFSKYLIEGVLTVMGVGCLAVAVTTLRTAKGMAGEIEEEEQKIRAVTDWFTSAYRKEDIDDRLDSEFTDLSEDERDLKRFELIQDLLITGQDLPDQAFVDFLCEEIYGKLFE